MMSDDKVSKVIVVFVIIYSDGSGGDVPAIGLGMA
jgi:hypothetical protein